MKTEELTDIVLKSVEVAKDVVDDKYGFIPNIEKTRAIDYLNELKNFYSEKPNCMAANAFQALLLRDFKTYLADLTCFSRDFHADYAKIHEKLYSVKSARNVTGVLTGISAGLTYFSASLPVLSNIFAVAGICFLVHTIGAHRAIKKVSKELNAINSEYEISKNKKQELLNLDLNVLKDVYLKNKATICKLLD